MGEGSMWHGVSLDGFGPGPAFAWTTDEKTLVRAEARADAENVRTMGKRERVHLLEASSAVDPQWWRIAEGEWIAADDLNEVIVTAPPPVCSSRTSAHPGNDQWLTSTSVSRVLVAYSGETPVFATLGSGRSSPDADGNYPIWRRSRAWTWRTGTRTSRTWSRSAVGAAVPAQRLQGAYWHDPVTGDRRCVNLAPIDARWVFDWAGPRCRGLTGYMR